MRAWANGDITCSGMHHESWGKMHRVSVFEVYGTMRLSQLQAVCSLGCQGCLSPSRQSPAVRRWAARSWLATSRVGLRFHASRNHSALNTPKAQNPCSPVWCVSLRACCRRRRRPDGSAACSACSVDACAPLSFGCLVAGISSHSGDHHAYFM